MSEELDDEGQPLVEQHVPEVNVTVGGIDKGLSESQQAVLGDLLQIKRDFEACFSGPEGERVWAYIRALSFFDESTFDFDDQKRIDTDSMLVNEGARRLFLKLKEIRDASDSELREQAEQMGDES